MLILQVHCYSRHASTFKAFGEGGIAETEISVDTSPSATVTLLNTLVDLKAAWEGEMRTREVRSAHAGLFCYIHLSIFHDNHVGTFDNECG